MNRPPKGHATFPRGKVVLLPIISAEADNIPEQTDKSEQVMIRSAKSGNDYAAISVRVEGRS